MTTNKVLQYLNRASQSDSGAIALMVAVMIIALLGVTALSTDVGYLYSHKRQLQTMADAAALAGVQDLPTNPGASVSQANNYVGLNTRSGDTVTTKVTISQTWAANDTITVVVTDPDSPYFFGRALGLTTTPISARSVARIGSPITYNSGVLPLSVAATVNDAPYVDYYTGQEIDLIVDKDDSTSGNWHYVDLKAFSDERNIQSIIAGGGSSKPMSIGDELLTEPGARENLTFTALAKLVSADSTDPEHALSGLYRDPVTGFYEPKHLDGTPCRRLIVTPVIALAVGAPFAWDTVSGNTRVKIIGFINMFVSNDPEFGEGSIKATFVQTIPDDALIPGPVTPYAGIITWLDE